MLDTKTPTAPLFRLGRKPDPWSPPDWSRAQPDGTFGNRFDDPQGNYRVLYAATLRVSCFVERLARFRPDLSLIAELQAIAGEDDYVPLGTVPSDWCEPRMMGEATVTGTYADIYCAGWVSRLRHELAQTAPHWASKISTIPCSSKESRGASSCHRPRGRK
jgi:hypothetical protein